MRPAVATRKEPKLHGLTPVESGLSRLGSASPAAGIICSLRAPILGIRGGVESPGQSG